MDARHVDPGREHVRVPRQRLRAEHPAVRQPPDPHPRGVDVSPLLQIFPRRDHVLILGIPLPPRLGRGSEAFSVADPGPVVHRQYYVALGREPLIDGVGEVIEVHVVVAEQHLAAGPAVDEDDRGALLARLLVFREEELVVEAQPVSRLEDHRLRHDRLGHRELPAQRRIDHPPPPVRDVDHTHRQRAGGR